MLARRWLLGFTCGVLTLALAQSPMTVDGQGGETYQAWRLAEQESYRQTNDQAALQGFFDARAEAAQQARWLAWHVEYQNSRLAAARDMNLNYHHAYQTWRQAERTSYQPYGQVWRRGRRA